MRRRQLSETIARQLERNETESRLCRAAFERNGQAFERMMAAYDRFERAFDENQVFMRDMHRRSELVTQKIIRDHEVFMQELNERGENAQQDRVEAARKTDRILARLDDASEGSKAFREALLVLIDRLPPPA
jgi:hypothetical protein